MINAPITLEHASVAAALDSIDAVQTMRDLFAELGNGQAVQPPQTLTEFPKGGDFITYPGALGLAGVFGAKLSPYLPQESGPIITAWTVLMSMETGQPLALMDAGALTMERTAATTALAVDHLAPDTQQPLTLAVIGTGTVAQAHMRHVAGLRNWREVRVFSPSLSNRPEVQSRWQQLHSGVTISQDASAAVRGADVVMLCTSSGTPVIDVADLDPAVLVTSISTNAVRAHEIDPAFLVAAEVYCDCRATTPKTAGEMVLAGENHGWSTDRIRGDLAELGVNGCEKPSGEAPVFFRSIGLGLEDIAIAHAVYQHVRA